ncbi:RagB/SusD family nutrient uptake outer membrane protein [Parapedobacter soli]|uniref:RagB/SusD family nutrient uptake outer membrane protein n=1 Tax=Parapedobacter soli TaxID=416955 RepID=UPI0021C8F501|nr:RagB/SusD family nutrient uptake outer membrane protein [Parapedobacter soli]
MKKFHIITILTTLFLFLNTSCSDFLDKMPDDQLTMEMIFTDKIRTEDWLASVYSSVPSPMWGYFKDQGFNIMADDITIPQEWQQFGWANVYAYTMANWNPNSGWNPNYWVELPKRIRTGLIFLEEVRVIPEAGLTQQYVDQMKNEVRFLIAYYYSLMIELYGAIPFAPGVVYAIDAPASELLTTQTPYDEIVDWIDQELKDVSTKLPAVYTDRNDWGRVTSIMALAVRARTLLFAASPLYNGNPDLSEWQNAEGVNLFDPNHDVQKWARAATAHKELIDAAHGAGYALYKEYNPDGSIDPFMSYYNMSLKSFSAGNREIIFGRPENWDLNGFQAHHLPKGIGGNAGMGVTQELVDAFYMENGVAPITGYNDDGSPIINPASGYIENGFSTEVDRRETAWAGGGPESLAENGLRPVTMDGTYNMYCNREPRFYVSVIFNEAWLGAANRRTEFLQGGGRDTGPTFDAPQNGYNVRKRISLDVFPREGRFTYQPGILYRLAEAYLSYAEALNEAEGPSDEAYHYVNLVRERAGIPNLEPGLDQTKLRAAIQHERRIEFNCEGIRFNDVRRWKLGEKFFNTTLYGMNFNGTRKSDDKDDAQAFYKRTFYKNRYFSKRMYIWPIPQGQMDINPNLRQAPGYGD